MTTVYGKKFMDENDVIDKSFFDTRNPFAKLERDSLARELRKKGWTVKSWKSYFDTATGYFLHAERRKETGTAYEPATPEKCAGHQVYRRGADVV